MMLINRGSPEADQCLPRMGGYSPNVVEGVLRRVVFTVREKPEEALAAVRGFLDKGPFGEVTRTDTMLEMRGPLVQKIGCIGWIILAVLSFGTAFTIWLAFMVVILLTPKPTVLVEA